MPPSDLAVLAGLAQSLRRVLVDRLEHPKRPLAQRRTRLLSISDCERRRGRRRRPPRAASRSKLPAKTASARKSALLVVVEELVAPLDRRAQRPLPLGRVPRAAGEERRARARGARAAASGRQQRRRARLRARARAAGRRGAGRSRRPPRSPRTLGRSPERARAKSVIASSSGSGATGNSLLAARLSGSRLVASSFTPVGSPKQLGEVWRRLQDLLEVVEQQQRLAAAKELGHPVPGPDALRDRRLDEPRIGDGLERNPEDTVPRSPRLPRPQAEGRDGSSPSRRGR